ncbi:hypothetical protein SAMN05444149_10747 [Pseudosulfitobacter pseudonitzschiae]|nr:hypothetical protein SAMN05444149_10747 [Pseudosulfitobacter pseudonitzschiae]
MRCTGTKDLARKPKTFRPVPTYLLGNLSVT